MRTGGDFGVGETPDFTAEAGMAQGPFPGSDGHRWQGGDPAVTPGPGAAGLVGVVRTSALPREQPGDCAGVGAAGAPAPARAQLRSRATPAGLRLLAHILCHVPGFGGSPCRTEHTQGTRGKTPRWWGRETPGDSNLSIGRVKAIIFYLQRMAESLVVSGAQNKRRRW